MVKNTVDVEKLLQTLDVRAFLEHNQIHFSQRRGGTELMLRCVNPKHEDKSGDSLHMNARGDRWNGCFKCSPCGFKGSFLTFLRNATESTLDEIFESLKKFGTYETISATDAVVRDRENALKIKDNALVDDFQFPPVQFAYAPFEFCSTWNEKIDAEKYMMSRNIMKEVAFSMEIGWNNPFKVSEHIDKESGILKEHYVPNAIVCPARFNGKIASFFLRCYDGIFFVNSKGKQISKLLPPDSPVGRFPYNIDSCDRNHPTIVVEGVMDALVTMSALTRAKIEMNVIACWSNSPTSFHIDLMREKCGEEIIFLPDRDSLAGAQLCEIIANGYSPNVGLFHEKQLSIALIPWGKDPGSCAYDEIIAAISGRKNWHEYTSKNRLTYGKSYCDF